MQLNERIGSTSSSDPQHIRLDSSPFSQTLEVVKMNETSVQPTVKRMCGVEFFGTFILVFFGVGAVHTAVLTTANLSLVQVALIWSMAVTLAIYTSAAISGAHLNPAVTVAMALYRDFPKRLIAPFMLAQLLGAFCAAFVLHHIFGGLLVNFETLNGIVRGAPGSELSAMVFGEYFPNPGMANGGSWTPSVVGLGQAMLAEGIGTMFLVLFVFAVTDAKNTPRLSNRLAPIFIGLAVGVIITVIAPLTQAGLNPARDFGPRLYAYLIGFGTIAIPGARGGFFTVYILAPIVGGAVGATIWQKVIRLKDTAVTIDQSFQTEEEQPVKKSTLILVGGFLGAGKTTMLYCLAKTLAQRGGKVGLITNDQAPGLVDTAFLSRSGTIVKEVAGSCFCCNFIGLISAVKSLSEMEAEYIIAEPVGSCTDLSATIIQPIKDLYPEIKVVPLTVLIDPERFRSLLGENESLLHEDAGYILKLQSEEADRVLISKADTLTESEVKELSSKAVDRFPTKHTALVSAISGFGIDRWLEDILSGERAGQQIVNVDYDRYAHGEAVLGWLNSTVTLTRTDNSTEWGGLVREIMEKLQAVCQSHKAEIGHIKMMLRTGSSEYMANLTSMNGTINTTFALADDETDTGELILNARVQGEPDFLQREVNSIFQQLSERGVTVNIVSSHCLSPGRPNPTHRYTKTV